MKNQDNIELNDLSKLFEYTRLCKEIDECDDIIKLKDCFKSYLKLYFSTLESITNIQNI